MTTNEKGAVEMAEITIRLADAEPVKSILAAAGQLALRVDWFLNDTTFTAPDDIDRQRRGLAALSESLLAFKATMRESGATF